LFNLAAARLRYIAGAAWSTKRYINMRPLSTADHANRSRSLIKCERFWTLPKYLQYVGDALTPVVANQRKVAEIEVSARSMTSCGFTTISPERMGSFDRKYVAPKLRRHGTDVENPFACRGR
jgi:hypothetical protein